jgi:hypothetical protein
MPADSVYHQPGTSNALVHLIFTMTRRGSHYHSHFIQEKTEIPQLLSGKNRDLNPTLHFTASQNTQKQASPFIQLSSHFSAPISIRTFQELYMVLSLLLFFWGPGWPQVLESASTFLSLILSPTQQLGFHSSEVYDSHILVTHCTFWLIQWLIQCLALAELDTPFFSPGFNNTADFPPASCHSSSTTSFAGPCSSLFCLPPNWWPT